MRIRDYEERDGPAVMAIETTSHLAAQWRVEDYQRLAADPGGLVLVAELQPARVTGLSSETTVAGDSSNVSPASCVAGFVAFHRVGDEAELRNLAVAHGRRRQGIGRLLAAAGHDRLLADGVCRVHLEVRPSNTPALSLYSSLGYTTGPVRKTYYRDPEEDALVLSLMLWHAAS